MTLKIAIQADPFGSLDVKHDTTLMLCREGHRRGYTLSFYETKSLAFEDGRISAMASDVTFPEGSPAPQAGVARRLDLRDMDVILIRQDPPFNMDYITATYLLEHLQPDVLVLNDPAGLRNAPEKLLVSYFPDLIPPTLITRDFDVAHEFRKKHGEVFLKPLYQYNSAGALRIRPDDSQFVIAMELLFKAYPEPFVLQRYIPEEKVGDKRIVMIEGQPVGAVMRGPITIDAPPSQIVYNRSESSFTDRDRYICERIGPTLKEMGLLLVGVDIIGSYLTEINVTSPSIMQDNFTQTGYSPSAMFWDAVLARLDA